jgi:L-seryl-tRNA(Ser) seleniumtransferase
MMQPGDDKIAAERLHSVLSNVTKSAPKTPASPAADLTGEWDAHIDYISSTAEHKLFLRQESGRLVGLHQGNFISRDLYGSIDGNNVKFASQVGESHGFALGYHFTGTVNGDTMSGDLDLGEYRKAKWSAKRHQFRRA